MGNCAARNGAVMSPTGLPSGASTWRGAGGKVKKRLRHSLPGTRAIADGGGVGMGNEDVGGDGDETEEGEEDMDVMVEGGQRTSCPLRNNDAWKVVVGIVMGSAIVFKLKSSWVRKQWVQFSDAEDQLAGMMAKLLVVAFFAFIACLWFWMEGMRDTIYVLAQRCEQNGCALMRKLKDMGVDVDKAFYPIALDIIMPCLSAIVGIAMWDHVWKSYVCKHHLDTSCKKTYIGSTLYGFRREYCVEGAMSCEIAIAYAPLFALTLFTLLGTMGQTGINMILENLQEKAQTSTNDPRATSPPPPSPTNQQQQQEASPSKVDASTATTGNEDEDAPSQSLT